ncbi:MFS transporter [Paenibacillus macquariensis]|uniref:MFS transporter, PPP family, 3-phenylpropionic acid transporter n=1 Tax=Paenibacillus macquariensis TaxID=948756 RepID=A0ABY1KDY2_9BACL|nr:MFS transporter [Paenibacillus macquariensis]MEC0093922.1 MFS transporter [Paenibacillus macquariensis]OAB34292.1 MFS transporter [Paenibacillus macquariensis subsp. macquariensis]SIR68112.1 MFS transporter, PPP family, 3-phenylpropionic acid transporter [Paenibacillus macquariensis]
MDSRMFSYIKAFNFFSYGAIAIYSTYFAIYLQSIGTSTLEIGALMAGGPIVSIIANPLWGYLSDRLGNIRRILIIMLTGNLLVMQLVFLADSYTLIYTFMIMFFFFQMPLFSQSNSLILNSIEGTSHKFGAFRLWGSLGWAVLAVGAGPVIGQIGIDKLWVVYDIMMLIAIGLTFTLPRGTSSSTGSGRVNYRTMFSNRTFLLFLIIGLVISIPNAMNSTFVGLYIADLGGNSRMIGWAAFFASIFEIPVFLLLDRYLKKDVRTMVLCLTVVSILYSLRWLLMSSVDTAMQIICIQTIHCLTFGAFYYIGTQLTAMIVPMEFRASGQAVYALTWGGLSGIAAGFIGGWMFDHSGPQSMYMLGGGMAAVGAISFALLYMYLRVSKVRITMGD